MKMLSIADSIEWCRKFGIELDERDRPRHSDGAHHALQCEIPKSLDQLTWFCRFVEGKMQPRKHCLLWISDWGVWESSENWHLYYRLRQSYGDYRLIEEAPGHLFLEFETNDLISFLQLGLIAGWDMHLLPTQGYGRTFISHDGWIKFAMQNKAEIAAITSELVSE